MCSTAKKKNLWTDETKINLNQNDEKRKVYKRRETAYNPKNTKLSIKHGGNVMEGPMEPGH